MSTKTTILAGATLLLALVALPGCGRAEEMGGDAAVSRAMPAMKQAMGADGADAEMTTASARVASPTAPKPQLTSLVAQRSIVRRAQVSVRVDSVEKAERAVNRLVNELGGYVDSAQSADLASTKPTIDLTLRIPVGQFDSLLDKVEGLGVRLAKTMSSEDVTGQIVDLDARLKTLSAQEETYRGILRQATGLENVITLQDKLTEVRSEIESMTAQRKTLSGLAALSTVTVHLEQSAAPAQAPADPNWLAQVWGESTTQLGALARTLTTLGIWAIVFSPLWLPAALLIRRAVKTAPRPIVPASESWPHNGPA